MNGKILCAVLKDGRLVGFVIADSSIMPLAPFKKAAGARVVVLSTGYSIGFFLWLAKRERTAKFAPDGVPYKHAGITGG